MQYALARRNLRSRAGHKVGCIYLESRLGGFFYRKSTTHSGARRRRHVAACRRSRSLPVDWRIIKELRRDFLQKPTGRVVGHFAKPVTGVGVRKCQKLLSPGNGYIKQATLLIEPFDCLNAHERRKQLLLKTHQKDRLELKPFGGMHRHKAHLLLISVIFFVKISD